MRYIDPFTDFGFKKLFGEEDSKDILIDFLNALLVDYLDSPIADLEFLKDEQLGPVDHGRQSIFDLYCRAASGEHFIVEMQRRSQRHFRDRLLYYSTFPLQSQGRRSGWSYELQPVYVVAIADFHFFPHERGRAPTHRYDVQLKDQFDRVFQDKLVFICLEMPSFTIAKAEWARLSSAEHWAFEAELKKERDKLAETETAREEGREEERQRFALRLLASGMGIEAVAELAGLAPERVRELATEG